MNPNKTRTVLGGISLIVVVAIFGGVPLLGFGVSADREDWPDQFQSNGERIYFTGINSSGVSISANGGGMHMQMHNGSCVTCHGIDRQGGRLMPRFWKIAPPLTPSALFDSHNGISEEDNHGGHEKYDDASLLQAITKGVDPDGDPLDQGMPRWSMDAKDISDIIEFLKSPVR